jgi:hypothetical protein
VLGYGVMLTELQDEQTWTGMVAAWHRFVLGQDPTLSHYDSVNTALLHVLLPRVPLLTPRWTPGEAPA